MKENSGSWRVILVITLMILAIAVPDFLIRRIAAGEAHASDSSSPVRLLAIRGTSSKPAPDFTAKGALICTNTNLINTCWLAEPSSVPSSSSLENVGD